MVLDFVGNPNRPIYDDTDDIDNYSDYDISDIYDWIGNFESSEYDSTGDEDYDPYEDYLLETASSISSASEVPGLPDDFDTCIGGVMEAEDNSQKPETFPTPTTNAETTAAEESPELVNEENANA